MPTPSTRRAISWEYLAGFFDGEGCIVVRRAPRRASAEIWLSFTQKPTSGILLEIADFLEQRGVKTYYREWARADSIEVHRVADVQLVLRRLSPYLHVKKEKAEEVLAYMDELQRLQKEFGQKYWAWTGYRLPNPTTVTGKEV